MPGTEQGKGQENGRGGGFCKLDREGLSEKGTFQEQKPEGGEGLKALWGKSVPSRGDSRCKGPGAGPSLVCSRNSEKSRVSDGGEEGERVRAEVRVVMRPDPVGPHRLWGSLWLLLRDGYHGTLLSRGIVWCGEGGDAEVTSFLAWSSGERPRWGLILGEVQGAVGIHLVPEALMLSSC